MWNNGLENYMCGMTNYGPAGSGSVPTRESTAHGVFVYSQYYWSNGNTEWPYMGSLAATVPRTKVRVSRLCSEYLKHTSITHGITDIIVRPPSTSQIPKASVPRTGMIIQLCTIRIIISYMVLFHPLTLFHAVGFWIPNVVGVRVIILLLLVVFILETYITLILGTARMVLVSDGLHGLS